jgi:hypothetical protein
MKYRKRPLVIEAEPYEPGKESEQRVCVQSCQPFTPGMTPPPSPHLHVGGGLQYVRPGDMIITEQGDRYVCPRELFSTIYEDFVPENELAPVVYDEAERLLREAEADKYIGSFEEENADGPSLDADSR